MAADLLGVTLWDEHKGSKKIKKILNANIGDESTVQRNKTKKEKKEKEKSTTLATFPA